jgi:hypothetical protein
VNIAFGIPLSIISPLQVHALKQPAFCLRKRVQRIYCKQKQYEYFFHLLV